MSTSPIARRSCARRYNQLVKVADVLVRGETNHRDRPMRNRTFWPCSITLTCVSGERVALRRDQCRGNCLLIASTPCVDPGIMI